MQQPQCADAVLMVRPAAFDYNPETAASNRMQQAADIPPSAAGELARSEFDHVVAALRSEGVRVCVAEDTPEPPKPDAVFPNNWVSFHADGTVVLYPLQAQSRRRERRREPIERAAEELGFHARRTLDLTPHESEGRFLEGTGSLVLDRAHGVAYACRSPRTHEAVLDEWCRAMGYEPVLFAAVDRQGAPLYHTNVMMSIGARFVLVATESIVPGDRQRVLSRLAASGREIIEIGRAAVEGFAGNVLELASGGKPRSSGERRSTGERLVKESVPGAHPRMDASSEALGDCGVLVMSTTARQALGASELARLAACADTVLTVPVPTIERLGGGSVRCMLAEVFSSP